MNLAEREGLEALLTRLEALDEHKYFARPIREVLAHQPKMLKRYLREIAHPLDFWTVRRRLRLGKYATATAFLSDVRQIFENARTFNESGSPVHDKASELLDELDALISEEGTIGELSQLDDGDALTLSMPKPTVSARELRNLTPSYHLPVSRTSVKRNMYIASQDTPSYYQWDVEQNEGILNLALSCGVPVDTIALPSFARLVDDCTHLPNEDFRSKRRRPLPSEDAALFEPKGKKDIVLMQTVYRKCFSDVFESALRTMATTTSPSDPKETECFEWTPPEGCRDIGCFNMPPNEFLLLFEELATPKEQDRLKQTLKEGNAQMIVHITPYSEIKRLLGLYGVRVQISDAPKSSMFHLVREPVTAILCGHQVTFKAVVDVVDASKLPKEYAARPGRRGASDKGPAASASATQPQAQPIANIETPSFIDELL